MLRRVSEAAANAAEIARTDIRDDEQSFGSIFSDIARLLWPQKTAVHIAHLLGCTERVAEMYLAGDRKWSGDAIAVVVAEIMRRHAMRNFKVKAKE